MILDVNYTPIRLCLSVTLSTPTTYGTSVSNYVILSKKPAAFFIVERTAGFEFKKPYRICQVTRTATL